MIRAWHADASGARELAPDEAIRLAHAGSCSVWLDLEAVEESEARALLAPLGVHPVALDDMVTHINRPKVDDYGDYLYVAVHSARWESGDRPTLRELDILVGKRFLVTFHEGATRSVAAAHAVLARRPELLSRGPAYLLHFLLDVLVDHYLPITEQIAVQVDEIEEQMFTEPDAPMNEGILKLKRGLSALRRIVGPQRDTVLALTRDEFRPVPAEVRPYLRDVYDRLARVSDLLDSFRDEVATLLELHVAVTSNRLNQVIKVLTVIATIMLPLTVITGYYGMNFHLPEFAWRWGWLYALGLLAATAFGTWWYIRRRHWY
ncbi:MAG TPA: magnesium/cobalt transporter CorA [Candidatus Eisenbacteria bacterium]|nr:magnesium/cobalt transporter CorA [Candidatus Eisenbacteria bacterium]